MRLPQVRDVLLTTAAGVLTGGLRRYGPRTLHLVLQWYNIFIFLWSVGIVSALGDVTIAGAVSHWYWTFKKPSDLPPNILRFSSVDIKVL